MPSLVDLKESLRRNKKTALILVAIVLIGIFLRTYSFHSWLRFSHDQARDAWIISSALKGKHSLPLLGPNAGTTAFQLGPAYYYFSYASEKIFGNYPDKMAYPSVFFSILSIPLLFLFLREFFNHKISLAMTAIMSVSYFLVLNSRFSSNPNLITFFVLLYLFAFLKILNNKNQKNIGWSILVGIGIGVGIQLHTTLLITMPIVTLCLLAFIFKKKFIHSWKILFIILATVLILNSSQIYHEIKSGGNNSKLFFKGFERTSGSSNYVRKIFLVASCQIQANAYLISSIGDDNRCSEVFTAPSNNAAPKTTYYLGETILLLFSFLGYFLLGKRYKKEEDIKKKNFLGLIILFNLVSFAILIPIADMLYVGYFINLFFIPFVLLGLIIEAADKRYKRKGINAAAIVIALLIASSLARDGAKADSYAKGLEDNAENSTLGQVELMRDYILSHSSNYNKIYFSGQEDLRDRFFYPLEYFVKENGKKIEKTDLTSDDEAGTPQKDNIFYIEENSFGKNEPGQTKEGYEIISSQQFSNQKILILKNQK